MELIAVTDRQAGRPISFWGSRTSSRPSRTCHEVLVGAGRASVSVSPSASRRARASCDVPETTTSWSSRQPVTCAPSAPVTPSSVPTRGLPGQRAEPGEAGSRSLPSLLRDRQPRRGDRARAGGGRAILGVVDGGSPLGVETADDVADRNSSSGRSGTSCRTPRGLDGPASTGTFVDEGFTAYADDVDRCALRAAIEATFRSSRSARSP